MTGREEPSWKESCSQGRRLPKPPWQFCFEPHNASSAHWSSTDTVTAALHLGSLVTWARGGGAEVATGLNPSAPAFAPSPPPPVQSAPRDMAVELEEARALVHAAPSVGPSKEARLAKVRRKTKYKAGRCARVSVGRPERGEQRGTVCDVSGVSAASALCKRAARHISGECFVRVVGTSAPSSLWVGCVWGLALGAFACCCDQSKNGQLRSDLSHYVSRVVYEVSARAALPISITSRLTFTVALTRRRCAQRSLATADSGA